MVCVASAVLGYLRGNEGREGGGKWGRGGEGEGLWDEAGRCACAMTTKKTIYKLIRWVEILITMCL